MSHSGSKLSHMQVFLPVEDESKLDNILAYMCFEIPRGEKETLEEIASALSDFPYASLWRCCQREPVVEKFCRTNLSFIKALQTKLRDEYNSEKSVYHASMKISSMDGAEAYDVLDLYMAACLLHTASSRSLAKEQHTDVKTALTNACYLGSYDALVTHCELMFNEIRTNANNLKLPDANIEGILAFVDQHRTKFIGDTTRLSKLYWGLGYVQAACRLYTLSQLSFQIGAGDDAEKPEHELSKLYQEQAIKNFLCAAALAEHEESKAIMHNIIADKDIFTVINKFFQDNSLEISFNDWPQGKLFFAGLLGQERYNGILMDATREINARKSAKLATESSASRVVPATVATDAVGSRSSSSIFQLRAVESKKEKSTSASAATVIKQRKK